MTLSTKTLDKIKDFEKRVQFPEHILLAFKLNKPYNLRFDIEHPRTKFIEKGEEDKYSGFQLIVRDLDTGIQRKLHVSKRICRQILNKIEEYGTVDLCITKTNLGSRGTLITYSITKIDHTVNATAMRQGVLETL